MYLSTSDAESLAHSGLALAQQGKLDEAIEQLRQAVRARPDFARAHHNLGVALADKGRRLEEAGRTEEANRSFQQAVASLQEAIRLRPRYAEAYYNLGHALDRLRQRDQAIASYQQAIHIHPDYVDALNNLGLSLTDSRRFGEAAVYLKQVVRLKPDFTEGWNNLGLALAGQCRFAEAESSYDQALRLNPRHAESLTNLGSTYKDQGRLEEAVACYQLALAHEPDSASTHWNLSLAWLQMGNYEQGWPEYEWRWKRGRTRQRVFAQPMWGSTLDQDSMRSAPVQATRNGRAGKGSTVLLHMEQGLGDMVQFIRYAALVKNSGARVVVECPSLLASLFASCPGVDEVVIEGTSLPSFDYQVPLMSLPSIFRTTVDTIPDQVPYLFADDDLARWWGENIHPPRPDGSPLDGVKRHTPPDSSPQASHRSPLRVGIAWQGNPHHIYDRHRSVSLTQFAPLARLPGVQFISLQKGAGAEQLAKVPSEWSIIDVGTRLNTFAETAAVMANLDLVITVDTAVAHLAGALGKPVWVLLSTISDWRWLMARDDSPWYPTMRLFRQDKPGKWGAVFERVAEELRDFAGRGTTEATIRGMGAMRGQPPQQVDVAVLKNWAYSLQDRGRVDEAVALLHEVVHRRSDHAEDHYDLGNALMAQSQPAQATMSFQKAVEIKPEFAEAHNNLGTALQAQGRLADATACFQEALRHKPDHVKAHSNLGAALHNLGRRAEGAAHLEEAIRLQPHYAEAHWNRGLVCLTAGNFAEGWQEYEWRWQSKEMAPLRRTFTQPLWDGSPLQGRTILLHAEQGLGDTMQFVRYAPLVKAQGGTVVLECQHTLAPLLQTCAGVDHIVPRQSPLPRFDVHAPLLSLPRIFGTMLDTIPADVPYLSADAELVKWWSNGLAALSGGREGDSHATSDHSSFRIGIVWQGNPGHKGNQDRSCRLADFAPLARLDGVRLYSLQKGTGLEQLACEQLPITDVGSRLRTFADTAAVLKNLDLIVTVDTAVAHCAGALGVPVWVLLPFAADWRWLLERDDSPWYPSMRLFRQQQQGEWGEIVQRISEAIYKETSVAGSVLASPRESAEAVRSEAPNEHVEVVTAEDHYQRGNALKSRGLLGEAVKEYQAAIRLKPDFAEAHNNLGNVLCQDRLDEAISHYEQAIRFRPDCAETHNNLAGALIESGIALSEPARIEKALQCYDRALQLQPHRGGFHWNKSLALLMCGNFTDGWREFEWRLTCRELGLQRSFPRREPALECVPRWDGSDLNGRPILLFTEGGFGDALHFIRYAPLVAQRGGQVLLECQPELKTMLQTVSGVRHVYARGEELPAFDVQCPLQCLPLLFDTTLETIPARVPYLHVDSERVRVWRKRLQEHEASLLNSPGPSNGTPVAKAVRVGLAWAGRSKPWHPHSPDCSLEQFQALAEVPGITFISLQKSSAGQKAEQPPSSMKLVDWTADLHDFADTAALVSELDLVITVDTSVAHLAGALGKPVWVILPLVPDFRWMLEREDSPWYPTMRLFRQRRKGRWEEVLQRIGDELARRFSSDDNKEA